MTLNDETYNRLKWLVQIIIPAIGTCYYGLSAIWGFPCGEEVIGTLVCIETLIGTVLGISGYNYDKSDQAYSGTIVIDKLPDDILESAVIFDKPIEDISDKNYVKLHVDNEA